MIVADYKDCSTAGVRQLDLQIIKQIQHLAPDALVPFAHLNVSIGSGCHAYLQAPALRALELALQHRKSRMVVNSAFRTIIQQTILWNHCQHRRCGIRAAAVPGASNHNTALSLDIEDAGSWRRCLEAHNWDWIGSFDPMHFDYKGGGTRDLRSLSVLAFQQLWNFNYPDKALKEDALWGPKVNNCILSTSVTGFPKLPNGLNVAIQPSTFPSLRVGMNNESVRRLQQALIKQGVILDSDGDFGESTLRGVKKFQLKNGLDPDGVVGAGTAKALGLS